MKFIRETIPYLIIILVVIILRTFVITPIVVNGQSMVPTLSGNEVMLLKKYDKKYSRFDIVVVDKSVEGDNLIKRVIGLPNETIKYRGNKLYINGEVVEDVYGFGETENFPEITLGDDEYFLMGDNRKISLDSRSLGVIKDYEIEGTVGIVIFPFTKFGKVKPTYLPGVKMADLHDVLPKFVTDTMEEGLKYFDNKLKGFADNDAILTGVETRSSSPVRILRDENLMANIKGIYPCGEGAGYAGGITTSAIDGIKCAIKILQQSKV